MASSMRRAVRRSFHKWSPLVIALAMVLCSSRARAEAGFPPRSAWSARSSALETPEMASSFAIDGDPNTRWGGPFASEHWLQVDLGEVAELGGVLLHWDSGFAARYRIMASVDGQEWRSVFEVADGQGGMDYIFFPKLEARYVRLASMPLSPDWGVSVLEFEPLAASQAPQLSGMAPGDYASETLWGGGPTPARALSGRHVTVRLPRPLQTTGLEVFWGAQFRLARLRARDASGRWHTLASDRDPADTNSLLMARKAILATELRLEVQPMPGVTPAIRRLRLLAADRMMTPLRRYEVAASRIQRALFPPQTRNQQVYWTLVGIPAGRQKSLFDEYGSLEPWKGGPMVQALWRDSSRDVHAAHNAELTHSLREGWMPMPAVAWQPEEGLTMRSEAMAIEHGDQPVTLLRHQLSNRSKRRVTGQLTLLVRPVQVDPPWQSGGLSPIREIALEGTPAETVIRVNGRLLAHVLSPPDARGAASFGTYGEGELTHALATGPMPRASEAHDDDGLAAAYVRYEVRLAPGEKRDVVLAFPLGNKPIDSHTGELPEAPPVDLAALKAANEQAGAAFERLADQLAQLWRTRLSNVAIRLPDASLIDMLRAQLAYMLLTQTGPAIQPGPRNYNRSFIRDGSATAEILMRMGLPQIARDYLRWYTDHAVHDNGLVSPILDNDGKVSRGFGADLEYDSQGQYVSFVAQIARLDGGPETVREYLPKVRLALRFLKQLRERTLVPGYLAQREAPERFRGLIAPSISHEGYSVPTHSYWDDYWALKGWHDGAWLANALGDGHLERFARMQYHLLRDSVAASVRATMAWQNLDTIPASADRGDPDPTSVSIALNPCGQQDLLPAEALERTFTNHLAEMKRREPGKLWLYSPYELRNVLSFVALNRPADAAWVLETVLRDRRPLAWQVYAEVVHSRLRHAGYIGDMPHTWIGAEYARAIIGMLLHETDERLDLLPGAPPSWLAGEGLSVTALPTAAGPLTMNARQEGSRLRIELGPGLRPRIAVRVSWPSRTRPARVWVDGQERSNQTNDDIRLDQPFQTLVAEW